jgi:putative ABC transport system permease protein
MGTYLVEGASIAPGTRSVWLPPGDFTAVFDDSRLSEVQVDPATGVSDGDARKALDRVLAPFPSAAAYDHKQYAERLNARLSQGLAVVTALLVLAVIIALVGVANTLALSGSSVPVRIPCSRRSA